MDDQVKEFIEKLASKSPVPGGGGASALIGAVGAALCSMVANLTSGKKKYAEHREEIGRILARASGSMGRLLELIGRDAEVFQPLSEAYGISRDHPDRDRILEGALITACTVPMEILREVSGLLDAVERLSAIGSRLAVSDAGVAASACRAAMEGAAMNVFVNTRLMKDRSHARTVDGEAEAILADGVGRCEKVYRQVLSELRG